ncbi:MAG: phosphoglycerate kinase [Firmicutes bacterium]|nr:phosphoglycerate kinase [Bacillota bacterium]
MKRMLTDLDLKGKTVLLRADFNVPLDDNGNIVDDTRIYEELPTIRYILKNGAKLIICSHLGRPKGEFNQKYSMFPVAQHLIRYLLNKIHFAVDVVGPDAMKKAKELKEGEILVLENLRFHKEEEANDLYFAKKLASMADVYVDDAFGTIHRKHASTYRVAKLLPNNAMGFLMGKEITTITKAMENPDRPFVSILGGAKVADKIGVVTNLAERSDYVLIGGAMAFTFLKAKGYNVGKSIVDDDNLEVAKNILETAEKNGKHIILPVDVATSETYSPKAKSKIFDVAKIPDDYMGLDIGPKTISMYKDIIKKAKTIIWNGPMGVFEFANFSAGTVEIAQAIAKNRGLTIVGGGDSVSAIKALKLEDKISHISTGGGATLALLEGGELPGLDALSDVPEEK